MTPMDQPDPGAWQEEPAAMSGAPRQRPDAATLLATLNWHGVRYVVFGSAGAVAHGADLVPGDLDICPDLDPENLRRLGDALQEIDAKPRYTPGWNTREECDSWEPQPLTEENFDHLFQTAFGDLDVVPQPYGPRGKADRFTYERLNERAVTAQAFGVVVRVAHLTDLIASKLSRRRAKDLAALPELERLQRRLRREQSPPAPGGGGEGTDSEHEQGRQQPEVEAP